MQPPGRRGDARPDDATGQTILLSDLSLAISDLHR